MKNLDAARAVLDVLIRNTDDGHSLRIIYTHPTGAIEEIKVLSKDGAEVDSIGTSTGLSMILRSAAVEVVKDAMIQESARTVVYPNG